MLGLSDRQIVGDWWNKPMPETPATREELLIARERLSWGLKRILVLHESAPARTTNDYEAGYWDGVDRAATIAQEALDSLET